MCLDCKIVVAFFYHPVVDFVVAMAFLQKSLNMSSCFFAFNDIYIYMNIDINTIWYSHMA